MAMSAVLMSVLLIGPFIDIHDLARRRAMARRLWRSGRGFAGHHRPGGDVDHVAVPADRAPAHPARGPDRGCDRGRHVRHRPSDRGDVFRRYAVARVFSADPSLSCACAGPRTAWCGGPPAPRWATACALLGLGRERPGLSRHHRRAMRRVSPSYVIAAPSVSHAPPGPLRRRPLRGAKSPGAACGARSGFCSCAIPG